MKRKAFAAMMTLALCVCLCACSAKSAEDNGYWSESAGGVQSPGVSQDYDPSEAPDTWDGDKWGDVVEGVGDAVEPTRSLAEKIIYSANVDIETVDFDAAVSSVEEMLAKYGAFLESSSVSGRSYSETVGGYQTYRRASFTIRVPVESFNGMREELGGVGAVVSSNVYTENITERFYDTEARVESYKIEQERLMDMLEKAGTVGEMLEIESRLSEVRYQLEALESTLKNWQNAVDYSTINVTLREVEEYKRVVEPHRSYWQQIGDGFQETLRDVGDFFAELFKGIVVDLPVIVLVAAVGGAVIAVVVRCARRSRAKRRERYSRAVDADVEPEEKKK